MTTRIPGPMILNRLLHAFRINTMRYGEPNFSGGTRYATSKCVLGPGSVP